MELSYAHLGLNNKSNLAWTVGEVARHATSTIAVVTSPMLSKAPFAANPEEVKGYRQFVQNPKAS
jgi:hypothetical protein